MQPILGRTWLEWIRLSRIFRAPFANLSLEIVKKMNRYYLLSGLSQIFRKPFANVYISRKVPFAQTFQIYACGPRSYKTFHGFLHDSHIACLRSVPTCLWSGKNSTPSTKGSSHPLSLWLSLAFQESGAHLLPLWNTVHIANAIVVKFPSGRSRPLADGAIKAWISSQKMICLHLLLLRVALGNGRKKRQQP